MPPVAIARTEYGGFPAVRLQTTAAELVVLPTLGAKAISLRFLRTGREWLWQDPTRPLRAPAYGDDFAAYDISGFDECFPTIGACHYPDPPWQGVSIPDHGELWSLPWECDVSGNTLHLHVHGVRFPYRFEKWITFRRPGCCWLRYRVTNLSSLPLKYIWSAHPLFAIEPGIRIVLPGTPPLVKEFGSGGRIGPDRADGESGYLSAHSWPYVTSAAGGRTDLRCLDYPVPPATDKVYARLTEAGWCALHCPGTGEYVALAFSPRQVPRVGVCVNMGAWPPTGARGHWAALEPCTGGTDRLDVSVLRGEFSLLPPHDAHEWNLYLSVGIAAEVSGFTPAGDLA